jgi:hypothetical protein
LAASTALIAWFGGRVEMRHPERGERG